MVHPVPTLIEVLKVPELPKVIVPPEQLLLVKVEIDCVPVIPVLS